MNAEDIEKDEVFNPISGDDLICEIVNMYPETVDFLGQIGMHCIGCASSQFENLRQACRVHGLNAALVTQELNKIVRGESEYA
ncbi:MAG: DUF1858 domain-containing protein [Hornefia sp.]|nr:DUF1858 domain-containing protein [Hornefia sp.]